MPNFSFLTSGFGARLRKGFPTPRYRDIRIEIEIYDICPLPGLVRRYM